MGALPAALGPACPLALRALVARGHRHRCRPDLGAARRAPLPRTQPSDRSNGSVPASAERQAARRNTREVTGLKSSFELLSAAILSGTSCLGYGDLRI